MKLSLILAGLAIGILAAGNVVAAEKEARTDVSDFPFWTAPKRGPVSQFISGLTSVIELTDAQKQQVGAARDAMMNDEGVKLARGYSKNDLNVTDAQREAARKAVESATAQMREKVDAVLTVEQKAMIGNINGAYVAALQEVGARYGAVKVDEEARRRMQEEQRAEVEKLFRSKLDEMLTASQKAALASAATQEEQRNAKVAGKKPLK